MTSTLSLRLPAIETFPLSRVGGLARYRVHTTATWDQFWNIIKMVRNHSDGVSLVSPWLIEYRSYKKIKSGTSHIAHHTSHITYYIGICKFYKILVINTVVTFKNSSKLILKTFDKYFLMNIITLTIQTPMAGLKSVKPTIFLMKIIALTIQMRRTSKKVVSQNISRWKETLS